MSLEQITKSLNQYQTGNKKALPPVELWDPPYCGEMDIVIKADGSWFYNGTVFKRLSLVKLFASVLKKENDEYFLVTPVEKIKISVEEAPLVLTNWTWIDDDKSVMKVTTNLDDEFILNNEHPVEITASGSLMVVVRRNLLAKVHRNVYYQWIELAQEKETNKGTELVFSSAECEFSLGNLSD